MATLLCLVATIATATDLRSVLTDYALESWSQKDGLPDASVYALAQDGDGYIWVGTEAGPYRFDGVRFSPWNTLTNSTEKVLPTRALLGASDGSMWVGFGGTGGIAIYSHGSVRFYGEADGLAASTVSTMVEDADGNHWAGTQSGLFLLRGHRWEHWGAERGVPTGPVAASTVTRDRRLLVTAGRSLLQFDRAAQRFNEIASLHDDPRAIAEDPVGGLLVSDQEDGFRGAISPAEPIDRLERGRGRALVRDRRNNIWVGTAGQGLWRVRVDQHRVLFTERASTLTGLLADGVSAVMEDREGNIWSGGPEGIHRLTPHKVAQVNDIGLVAGVERAGAGSLWVGTIDELLEMPLGSDRISPRHHALNGARLRSLHADKAGTLWVATNEGVSRLRGDVLTPLPVADRSSMPKLVDSITSDGHGGIWVFDTERGLLHWHNGRFDAMHLPDALAGARVEATLTDTGGRAWFTFSNGLLATSDNGDFHVYGKADGVDGGVYQALFEDDDHVIWLGGTLGLTRFNGSFVTTRSDRGFPVANVTAIVVDGEGTLWVGSGAGIHQIRRAEWERLLADSSYRPQFRLYDRADGLAGLPFVFSRNRRAIRADDGRLWFVTSRGLTIIDPTELGSEEPPHQVHVEWVVANGVRLPVVPGSAVTLPAGTNRLEVEYSALNLTSPLRQHFRYRLEGFDGEWVDAGTRRQAFYTNLPPRSYTFRVMSSDAEGSWTKAEVVAIPLSIRPMFYQTFWFLGLSVVGIALVIGASWRLHVRSVRRQFALLIGERARLSRELHDTLLQSLVGIALQFDAMANDPHFTASQSQRWEFVRLRKRVEDYIREARQSITDLRSPRLDKDDLATALRETGEREVDGRGIELSFRQQGTPRAYPAGLEDQLLKIGREAIVNAARHSDADRIAIELETTDGALTLRVIDNGRGFDPQAAASDGTPHYGLTSMRERAEDVGGQFTIESVEGEGTRVETTVPLEETPRGKRYVEPTLH